jgi:hypothetical protein
MDKAAGCITIIGIFLIVGVMSFSIFNKYVFGNKQIIDLKQNYNTAYIMSDDNKFEKVSIKAWKDWENSDAIQVILTDGTPVYTHLRNVKLTVEK